VIATEEWVAVEYDSRGTQQAPSATPYRQIPPTVRRAELSSCDVYHIKNGKIVRIHPYSDWANLLQQLGVMPQSCLKVGKRASSGEGC